MVEYARKNPERLHIGIDSAARALEKISEKIHRRSEKGGLPNVLFLQASVEQMPSELDGVAGEVHVLYPWGSLLGAVAGGDPILLANLRRICKEGATLHVLIGTDAERDRAELERLGVEPLSLARIDSVLAPRYRAAGFEIAERGIVPPSDRARLQTTWGRRVGRREERVVFTILARTRGVR